MAGHNRETPDAIQHARASSQRVVGQVNNPQNVDAATVTIPSADLSNLVKQGKPTDAKTSMSGSVQAEQIQANIRRVAKRQWWMWSSAVMVTLLLTLGIASFAFPGLLSQAENSYSFFLGLAMRGLVGLVLLFNVYTIYQQLQIHRIQRQLSDQIVSLGKIEVRTEEVYKLAALDPLTCLYNRHSGEQRLAEEVSRSERYGRPLTILMLDLNDLKKVNDGFGHAAGDALIKCFAEGLNKAVRGSDAAIRLGGDEFLVLLPECKVEDVGHVLKRLSGLKMDYDGQTIPITFSAGWTNHKPGESPAQLLKRADDALYANKRATKGESQLSTTIAADGYA
jgi:diguanylate cyclase (GGDEF)-like protein